MVKGNIKTNNIKKVNYIIILVCIIFLLLISIPTMARFKNRNTLKRVTTWDGSVAKNYRSGDGSKENPFLITNGSELAHFSEQLETNNYLDIYFELNNDIIINEGIFKYDANNGILYIKDNITYYVDHDTNKYYKTKERDGEVIGTINTMKSFDNFKGHFNGNSFSIFGFYLSDEISNELAPFTNLNGNINNLYLENTMIYGGNYTSGVVSVANNSELENIFSSGYVVGNKDYTLNEKIITLPNIEETLSNDELIKNVELPNKIPLIHSDIKNISITGKVDLLNKCDQITLFVNDVEIEKAGEFELELNNEISKNLNFKLVSQCNEETNIKITNLQYNVKYNHSATAGIIALSHNNKLKNIINKSEVYGEFISSGLIGTSIDSLTITNAYNKGAINSENKGAGLIGVIEQSDDVIINKSFNEGNINLEDNIGLISNIYNVDNMIVQNSFNTANTNYLINTIQYSVVNFENVFYTTGLTPIKDGIYNGMINVTFLENLKDKEFLTNYLYFEEFDEIENISEGKKVWIFEEESLPILYIDDLNKPLVNINALTYSWNNYSTSLNGYKFSKNITFNIEEANELNKVENIYYYISNTSEPLFKEELNQISKWETYNDIVQIKEEGIYVIYAKIIDINGNVFYINTDALVLDSTGITLNISYKDFSWSEFSNDLKQIYIYEPEILNVSYNSVISSITNAQYYISNEQLTSKELDQITDYGWNDLEDDILVSNVGNNIVYVKLIDNFGYVTYANTDKIYMDSYINSKTLLGRGVKDYLNKDYNINTKSSITLTYKYLNEEASDDAEYSHNLITSSLLPKNTIITLIDNIKEKVYTYQIPTDEDYYNYNKSCESNDGECYKYATYPFTLFKEVGIANKPFVEESYFVAGKIEENFDVIIDFSKTNITENLTNVKVKLEKTNNNIYITTNDKNIKTFNVLQDSNYNLKINTDYEDGPILYNTDSVTNINLTGGVKYFKTNNTEIIDTSIENKILGLAIRLVDSDGKIIDKKHLKNLTFKIDKNQFYPENDNVIRAKIDNNFENLNKTLTVITNKTNNTLKNGEYYLEINTYLSIDGYYFDEISKDKISIPIIVDKKDYMPSHLFDVQVDVESQIINKEEENVDLNFNIIQGGELEEPNIRISLYQKNQLTAYDQSYSLIDLDDYITNNLEITSPNVYYLSKKPVEYTEKEKNINEYTLNIKTNLLENHSYKFVFDLYDNNIKISSLDKYFIVK